MIEEAKTGFDLTKKKGIFWWFNFNNTIFKEKNGVDFELMVKRITSFLIRDSKGLNNK